MDATLRKHNTIKLKKGLYESMTDVYKNAKGICVIYFTICLDHDFSLSVI